MTTLHTVNKSPFERNALDSCLNLAAQGSGILLFEDGIYGALKGTTIAPRIQEALGRQSVYVLGPDLEARGMDTANLIDGIKVVDYGGFVELAAEHTRVQAWL